MGFDLGLLMAAIVVTAFVVMIWLVGRRTRRLYAGALEALEDGRIVSFGPFPRRVTGRWEGREVRIWKNEGSQYSPSRLHLTLGGACPYSLTLTPQGAVSRLAKRIGWGGGDMQVGDDELDEAFVIHAGDAEWAARTLRSAAGRAAALRLHAQGFDLIQLDGSGLRVGKSGYGAEDFEPHFVKERLGVMRRLMEAAEGGAESAPAGAAQDGRPGPALPAGGAEVSTLPPHGQENVPLGPAGSSWAWVFLLAAVGLLLLLVVLWARSR